MSKKQEVKETKDQLPAETAALDALFDGQTDGADIESFAIPFIKIIQSESPQVKPQKSEYNEDARPGQIVNTVTQSIANEITILPVSFQREFLEWGPKTGDGLKGRHSPAAEIVMLAETDERKRRITPTGNILADTRNHYVLVIGDEFEPAILPMASTQIKKSKALMTQIQTAIKARKLMTYKLTTGPESNDSGDWYGWVMEAGEDVSANADLVAAATSFKEAISKGNVVVDETEFGGTEEVEEEIPFK